MNKLLVIAVIVAVLAAVGIVGGGAIFAADPGTSTTPLCNVSSPADCPIVKAGGQIPAGVNCHGTAPGQAPAVAPAPRQPADTTYKVTPPAYQSYNPSAPAPAPRSSGFSCH